MRSPWLAVAPAPRRSTACGGATTEGGGGGSGGEIDYWLWDANQQPAYQKCADAFAAANPGITVKITQCGWDDYWSTLTTGFESGHRPRRVHRPPVQVPGVRQRTR